MYFRSSSKSRIKIQMNHLNLYSNLLKTWVLHSIFFFHLCRIVSKYRRIIWFLIRIFLNLGFYKVFPFIFQESNLNVYESLDPLFQSSEPMGMRSILGHLPGVETGYKWILWYLIRSFISPGRCLFIKPHLCDSLHHAMSTSTPQGRKGCLALYSPRKEWRKRVIALK